MIRLAAQGLVVLSLFIQTVRRRTVPPGTPWDKVLEQTYFWEILTAAQERHLDVLPRLGIARHPNRSE
ncbi:MAG: hypothetical protein WCF85_18810 [Rhodospirillaceae bacterium]